MPFCSVVLSFALIAFCFLPHYAFIIVLFYHVIVSFVVGCLGRVSCLLRRRLFSVFGLCSLVFSLFEAFIFDFIYYRGRSLGMPLVKEFYSVKAGRVRIGFLRFRCVSGNAVCCPLRL